MHTSCVEIGKMQSVSGVAEGLPSAMVSPTPKEAALMEFITCAICKDEMESLRDPRSLPCLHTYCYECLVNHAKSQIITGKKKKIILPCPICRGEIETSVKDLSKLRKNFNVTNIADAWKEERCPPRTQPSAPCRLVEPSAPVLDDILSSSGASGSIPNGYCTIPRRHHGQSSTHSSVGIRRGSHEYTSLHRPMSNPMLSAEVKPNAVAFQPRRRSITEPSDEDDYHFSWSRRKPERKNNLSFGATLALAFFQHTR